MRRLLLAALALLPGAGSIAAQTTCQALTGVKLAGASVTDARQIAAGPFTPPPDGFPAGPEKLPAYCRVQGVARPTADSEIRFEVWLPEPAAWNGKFQQRGNGGYAGSIPASSIADGLARGYATAGTDDGHTGQDPSFAIGHPERVIDFGHRAVHLTSVHAKAIVAAYYGKPANRSYFVGCSDGGREALMEAQRYPADFDGIVVGAPANNWTRLMTSAVWNWKALTETPASMIPAAKLPAIQRAVVAACDQLDRVKDGLIEDPRRCRFDPSKLRCAGADRDDCLTAPQVVAIEKLYRGPVNPKTGERIYPGAIPGGEAVPGNWGLWMVPSTQMPLPLLAWFGTSFFQAMVFENPKWDYRTIDFDRDVKTAIAKLSPHLDATDPDLRPFRQRGGKLIQYHGWSDAAITATGSIDYYEQVIAKLGKPVDDFYRLFMVPGLGHCGGGLGPNDFGNVDITPHHADPDRDIVAALDRWVEKGIAPERIIAAGRRTRDAGVDFDKPVELTRPICPHPKVASYSGAGSPDSASSFGCVAPGGR